VFSKGFPSGAVGSNKCGRTESSRHIRIAYPGSSVTKIRKAPVFNVRCDSIKNARSTRQFALPFHSGGSGKFTYISSSTSLGICFRMHSCANPQSIVRLSTPRRRLLIQVNATRFSLISMPNHSVVSFSFAHLDVIQSPWPQHTSNFAFMKAFPFRWNLEAQKSSSGVGSFFPFCLCTKTMSSVSLIPYDLARFFASRLISSLSFEINASISDISRRASDALALKKFETDLLGVVDSTLAF